MPSKIEWTQETWNPLVGCTLKSPGCTRCYAMSEAWRKMHHPNPKIAEKFKGTAKMVNGKAVWTGRINFWAPALDIPLRRTIPTTYFVNSLSDLFHDDVPDSQIDQVLAVIALCPQHRFQVLTKRSARMREYFYRIAPTGLQPWKARVCEAIRETRVKVPYPRKYLAQVRVASEDPIANLALGVSAEDQPRADERFGDLLATTAAAIRFASLEPLLGPIDFNLRSAGAENLNALTGLREKPTGPVVSQRTGTKLDWIILGGESGKDSRPMNPEWAISIRDQCLAAGTAFFFKQWGDWHRFGEIMADGTRNLMDKGERPDRYRAWPGGESSIRVGKAKAGHFLDGEQYLANPFQPSVTA